jgi:peptidoglycan/xylan/chitin deacetylase (PgdA/CDA1 family)
MTPAPDRYADRLVANGVAIFLFHGVIRPLQTEVRNYTRKHLPVDDFVAVLRSLKARGTPVSMDDVIADRAGQAPLPKNAFAVTFDDGFENNLTVAAPILADEKVPATFYVTTDFIDRNRMSWIDRIEYAVEAVRQGSLRCPWGTASFDDPSSKRRVLDEIRLHVKSTPAIAPDAFASDVQRQLGFPEVWSNTHPLDQKLTWNQVAELAAIPGCTVGGHSHTHPILAYLADTDLRHEITTSLRLLHDKAGLTCRHYSYPEGLEHCFDERVIACLKEQGIVCSPTAIDGVNEAGVDLFHLRRIFVV